MIAVENDKIVSKRILFVDDDYTDQRIVAIVMRKYGVAVDECMTPTSAPLLINKNGYDAVIVDYRLPILNGVELVKKMAGKLHCPVYITSAHDRDFILREIGRNNLQVAGFISKDGLRKNLEAIAESIYGPPEY